MALFIFLLVNVLAVPVVRADAVTNAVSAIAGQLCPLLDSLTQAAASAAQSDRVMASTQLDSVFGLANELISTIQSPDMPAALGGKGKALQNGISRLWSQLVAAKSCADNSASNDAAVLKSMLKAVSKGQQLKKLLLSVPSSGTVVLLSEVKSSAAALHYSGDSVCFHVNIRNALGDPSCSPPNVSVDQIGGDPTDVLIIGAPSMSSPTDFCLTTGPDAGTFRVTVSTCNQSNSVLLYNYGVPKKSGPLLAPPQDLNVSASAADTIELAWTDSAGADGFKIERAMTAVGPWTIVGVVDSTTVYVDSGLSESTTYYYRVHAYDKKGYSDYSNIATGNTSTPASDSGGSTPPLPASNMPADEFNGPFASWTDLKVNYGAVGNGVADDTSSLQAALNDLGASGHSAVLYIPAGTYRITRTVTLQSRQHVSIIGADPSTTTLKWAGATGGVLLHLDGVTHGRYDRLTFDGSSKAGVLVDQGLTGYNQGQYFDTGNEYADDVFQDAVYGIRGGVYGLGAAESSVLRCQFLRHTGAGILLCNYNAVDWFLWYCTFTDNNDGVSNNDDVLAAPGTKGAGNFHVFGSLFQRSTNADIDIWNLGLFSFRYNTSLGSKQFCSVPFYWTNGSPITFQDNTIADTTSDTAISIGVMGPILLIDNVIASRNGASGAVVVMNSYDAPDMIAVGNTFTVNNPMTVTGGTVNTGTGTPRFLNVDNQTVARSSLTVTAPTLPGVLPNNHRTTFEVAAGANASTIQTAINQAAALSGQRPVVHLAQGTYNIAQTLVVPANADVQLIGDGAMTLLSWTGVAGTNPVIRLAGPSRAILRDLMIQPQGNGPGIQVDNADQSGARVYMEQVNLTRGLTADLLVDRLDHALVELHDFYPSSTYTAPAVTGVGLKVVGGPSAASGAPQAGRTSVFAGAASNNYLSFEVTNGGRLLVNDLWYEGPYASTFAHIADNSVFTVDNCQMAMPQTGYSVRLDNLSGKAAILNSMPDAPVGIFGTGNGTAWVAGNESHGPSNYFANSAVSTVGVFSENRWYDTTYGSRSVADQGTADANLVRSLLAQLRAEKPLDQPTVLPSGVTDLRLYRVFIDYANTGIHISR